MFFGVAESGDDFTKFSTISQWFQTLIHPLIQQRHILIIGILSVIAGGKGWEDMENYGLSKYDWLEQFLALPEGIPSADTFRRVFEPTNPKVFERCFRRWVQSIVEAPGAQVIPIDHKLDIL